jgi:hypothetical protein
MEVREAVPEEQDRPGLPSCTPPAFISSQGVLSLLHFLLLTSPSPVFSPPHQLLIIIYLLSEIFFFFGGTGV